MILQQLSILIQVDGKRIKKDLGVVLVPTNANNSIINYLILILNYSHLLLARADIGIGSKFAFEAVFNSTVVSTNLQLVRLSH